MVAGAAFAEQSAWAASQSLQFAANTGLLTIGGVAATSPAFAKVATPASLLFVSGVAAPEAARRRGTETPPVVVGTAGTQQLAQIAAYVAVAHTAGATVVLDASYGDDHDHEEQDTLWLARVVAGPGGPPPPPPPPPTPPPPPPPGPCYVVGAKIPGFLKSVSTAAGPKLVFDCPVGQECYADYMLPDGEWARAYGHHTTRLVRADGAAASTVLTEAGGRWGVTVTVAGVAGAWVWRGDPDGFLGRGSVTAVEFTNASFACAALR